MLCLFHGVVYIMAEQDVCLLLCCAYDVITLLLIIMQELAMAKRATYGFRDQLEDGFMEKVV